MSWRKNYMEEIVGEGVAYQLGLVFERYGASFEQLRELGCFVWCWRYCLIGMDDARNPRDMSSPS